MGLLTSVKKLWVTWDLRVCIITSLSLQAFLLLLAPFRQRSRSGLLFKSVWATYLLADWIAAVAIGLIAKSLGRSNDHKNDSNLFALWASFLLMHLGGPDGITSLSLEDNELWIRHLFGLILQVLSAIYSLYLTFSRNKLWGPSILVFIGGTIKFAERTWALRLASLDSFGESALPDPNPGPDYEEAASEYSVMMPAQFLTVSGGGRGGGGGIGNVLSDSITTVEGPAQKKTEEMKKLEVARSLFESFKGLIVGFLISSKDRDSSRNYFMQQAPEYAFRLVEYELSFMYQVLHTKSVVMHTKIGYALRGVSFLSTFGASLFFLFVDKSGFDNFEVAVTYALIVR
ncbi:hypothetical protein TIFTF001_022768 [Ficus carica]|uniref:DUF4220 domain-containing protein n=1 Tax=Ficus carica TaxID=3494 RepID=A0AA88AZP3_FICCA|nr:hypothetical protein TIFTF001_022768 [Ficus carica]